MTSNHDPGRPRLIVATAAGPSLINTIILFFAWSPRVALGYVGGAVTGAGMLSALVFVLNRAVVPPNERRGSMPLLMVLHVGKFALAAAFAYLLILVWQASAGAFAVGYTVAVIVLLIIIGGQRSSIRLPDLDEDDAQ
jgi:hypothetical protein